MIREIKNIIGEIFKEPKKSKCTICINEIFDLFARNINNKKIKEKLLTKKISEVFQVQYPTNPAGLIIPYKALIDLFNKEQLKHA